MEAFTLLLSSFILIIAMLFLFPSSNKKSQRLTKMLNEIPGPPSYPLIGSILPFVFKKRNELFAFIQENIKNQAPLFRTWNGQEPIVHLTRPEHIEVILRSSEYLDKSFVYNFLHRWLGTGLLTSTGQKWHSHRKMITPTFHFKILDNFLEVFSEQSEILVRKLQKEAGGSGFDVYPYITKCALDIICETAMGTSIYAQDNADSDYVKAVYDMSEITVRRMFKPWLHPNVLFKLSQMGRRHDECIKVLHGFTNRVIRERKSQLEEAPSKTPTTSGDEDMLVGKKKRKAFLDLLLEASLNGVKLTDEELREEVDTFMFEGHDTTSAGMCWTLFLFGLHPDVQEKAYQELQSIFQDSDRSPTMKDLADMKYLEQVIKEALRLYPSVPMFGRKLFADVKIGDYTIPAGTTINIHSYRVHRCPDQFPDPEKFDPDNFLAERIAKRHPYAYIPFSAGPRNCIGQKFALLEEKTVLSYILRHYKVKSLEKREDINLIGELILRPENGIKLGITSRKTMKNNV